jgi:hypothetical protein
LITASTGALSLGIIVRARAQPGAELAYLSMR